MHTGLKGPVLNMQPTVIKGIVHPQLIECDSHAHDVSKAGSVISSKSPLPAFR